MKKQICKEIKRFSAVIIIAALLLHAPVPTYAAGWVQRGSLWYHYNQKEETDHGWVWIDGYCYYFKKDGSMAAKSITPDGYFVNAMGQWIVDGVVQYDEYKGIAPKYILTADTETIPYAEHKTQAVTFYVDTKGFLAEVTLRNPQSGETSLMYDDGDLENHGDQTAGDQIYSSKIQMDAGKIDNWDFQSYLKSGDSLYETNIKTIWITIEILDEEYKFFDVMKEN